MFQFMSFLPLHPPPATRFLQHRFEHVPLLSTLMCPPWSEVALQIYTTDTAILVQIIMAELPTKGYYRQYHVFEKGQLQL